MNDIFFLQIIVVLLSISIHEFAHAKFADLAGDDLPRLQGRVTLNPLAHLDPIGTIMIIVSSYAGFGIGWGKPVMVRPDKMNNPRWDHFISVAAGPLSNFLQAVIYALLFKVLVGSQGLVDMFNHGAMVHGWFAAFCFFGVMVNIGLGLFNLVPIGPLDGHWMVGAFLPDKYRIEWYRFNRGIGSFVFIALVLIRTPQFDFFGTVLEKPTMFLIKHLLGVIAI